MDMPPACRVEDDIHVASCHDKPAKNPYPGPKRRRVSPELAGSPALWHRPTAKKPRTKKHRFPGAHIEVWHKDSDVTPVVDDCDLAEFRFTPSVRDQTGWIPISRDPLVRDGGLNAVHDPFNSTTISATGKWPLSDFNRFLGSQYVEAVSQSAKDAVASTPAPSTGTDLAIPNYGSSQYPSSPGMNVLLYSWEPSASTTRLLSDPRSFSHTTASSPGLWTDTTYEPVPMIGRSGLTRPLPTHAFDYQNNLPALVVGDLSPPPSAAGAGGPCYNTEVMTGHFSINSEAVHPVQYQPLLLSQATVHKCTEYIGPCHPPPEQDRVSNPVLIPRDLTNMNNPPLATFPPMPNHILPVQPPPDVEPTPYNGPDQCPPDNDLPGSRLNLTESHHAEPLTAVDEEEEIFGPSAKRQLDQESCTCQTQTHEASCSASGNGARGWVMVAYKLSKPMAKAEKKPRKPRRRLDGDALLQTNQTRDTGACIRCKIQRLRCIPDAADPAAPCQPCSRVIENISRKIVHHIPCHRYKLREVVLFRTSASNVTNRWHGDQVRHVRTSGRKVKVHMMQDFVSYSFAVDVCPVAKTSTGRYHDKTTRDWYDGAGIVSEPVSAYALADVQRTTSHYKDYIRDSVLGVNCKPSIQNMAAGFWGAAHDSRVVGDIYAKAWEYFCSLPKAEETWDFFYQREAASGGVESSRSVSETTFLLGLFELQFALRHATGWSWLLDGDIPDAARIRHFPPLRGRVSTPRLVVGQIDAIRISSVLKPLTKSILRVLTTWISDRQYNRWLTIFFAIYILLAEIAKATEDAYHHGWYDKEIRGDGPKNAHIVRDLHETANIILGHWHYYNCGIDLPVLAQKEERSRMNTPLRSLSPDQLDTAQQVWEAIRQWKQRPNNDRLYGKDTDEGWWVQWCHPMYFADQMIDLEWTARPVFS